MANTQRMMILLFAALFALFQAAQPMNAYADQTITKVTPQILGTPEEEIPASMTEGKKSNALVWIGAIVGIALVAALVGAGGGGSDTAAAPAGGTDQYGDVEVSW